MQKLSRVWHPINRWEEIEFNMWGDVSDSKEALALSIKFTSDHKKYGRYMMRVVNEWPISCENALTDPYLNHKAWIGHAAVALALQIPEDITRKAWGKLTDEQQFLANKEAERAIQRWKYNYGKDRKVHQSVERQML